jgi:hypothetical protein
MATIQSPYDIAFGEQVFLEEIVPDEIPEGSSIRVVGR